VQAVIDRWWDITASAAVTANIIFTYRGTENTMSAAYQTGAIGAQHWNGTSWDPPVGTGTGVTAGTGTVTVSGASTFSPWVISALAAPLPIELLYLDASCQGNDVILKWATATETSNDYFTVERSYDGQSFEAIAIVDGAGNSSTMNAYTTVDKSNAGNAYYRLKQTDFNGNMIQLGIVSSSGCNDEVNGNMFVVVNEEGLTAVFTSAADENYVVTLYDVAGRKIIEQQAMVEKGINTISLPRSLFSTGIYLFTLQGSANIFTSKVAVH
jgi:hypothetical protein